jgi:hypothetical protein
MRKKIGTSQDYFRTKVNARAFGGNSKNSA